MRGRTDGNRGEKGAREDGGGQGKDKGGTDAVQENTTGRIAEYGIVMLAAVGFAGLLVLILKSDEVRSMLLDIVRNALSIAGNTGLL